MSVRVIYKACKATGTVAAQNFVGYKVKCNSNYARRAQSQQGAQGQQAAQG